MAISDFQKMFEPIKIGQMSVKNRVILPSMATCFATAGGFVSDQMVGYYSARAKGDVGLIIVEAACIDDPVGRGIPYELGIDDDKYIEGLGQLAEAVHSYGAKIAIQLHHAGPNTHLEGGAQPVAPSPIPLGHRPHEIPRELSKKEIIGIVKKFAQAAKRAKLAGFDAVELLCAHGYLLNRFLSPHANKRQDEYGGGTLGGRIRILKEIVDRIKAEAGKDLAILCKVPGDDYVDGGITLEEGIDISKHLQDFGVNALTITGGSSEAKFSHIAPSGYSQGWQAHLAEKVKQNVNIPVATIGRIKHPKIAEEIIRDGKADMVAIGRALIADPELVMKSKMGKVDRIIPCISCNHCLDRIVDEGKTLRCSVNPLTGREYDTRVVPAARSRKIVVVGGGPAGMQAAIVAASRGHKVILFERNSKLGGQLLLAAIPPDKEEIEHFTEYLCGQLKEKGVDIRLNTRVTGQVLESVKPEVIISATGASPSDSAIPGAKLENVISAWDTLAHAPKAAKNVVVIGGGLVGCEVACYLSKQGKKVTIVEQLDDIGFDLGSLRKFEVERLQKGGVTIMTKTLARKITIGGIEIDTNGKSNFLVADTIVLALGAKSDRELLQGLESAKMEVYAIGDCVVPRSIAQASLQGFYIGCCI